MGGAFVNFEFSEFEEEINQLPLNHARLRHFVLLFSEVEPYLTLEREEEGAVVGPLAEIFFVVFFLPGFFCC